MKIIMKKITAAVSGAVLAFSAAGSLPVSAEVQTVKPSDLPEERFLTLLGESTLTDGKFAPIEIAGAEYDAYDTFYVTANQSCAAHEISLECTQKGFYPIIGDFIEMEKVTCKAIVAMQDAAFRIPRYSELYDKTSFHTLSVTAEVTKPFDASLLTEKDTVPENETLTIKLYGICEEPEYVPIYKTKLLAQSNFTTNNEPEITMVTDGVFRYADLSIDGGANFDGAGITPSFCQKVWKFNYVRNPAPQTEQGTAAPAASNLIVTTDEKTETLAPVWENGCFSTLIDRSDDKNYIPKFAQLSVSCKQEDESVPVDSDPVFRLKLNASDIVDDDYDTFRIHVENADKGNTTVRLTVFKKEDGKLVNHSVDFLVETTEVQNPYFLTRGLGVGGTGTLEVSAKELDAGKGTVILVDSAQYESKKGMQKITSGKITVEGIRNLIEQPGTSEPEEKAKLYGDADCSGNVDVSDAVLIARLSVEDKDAKITAEGKLLGDVNHDGTLSSNDVILILQYISKLVSYSDLQPKAA